MSRVQVRVRQRAVVQLNGEGIQALVGHRPAPGLRQRELCAGKSADAFQPDLAHRYFTAFDHHGFADQPRLAADLQPVGTGGQVGAQLHPSPDRVNPACRDELQQRAALLGVKPGSAPQGSSTSVT